MRTMVLAFVILEATVTITESGRDRCAKNSLRMFQGTVAPQPVMHKPSELQFLGMFPLSVSMFKRANFRRFLTLCRTKKECNRPRRCVERQRL